MRYCVELLVWWLFPFNNSCQLHRHGPMVIISLLDNVIIFMQQQKTR